MAATLMVGSLAWGDTTIGISSWDETPNWDGFAQTTLYKYSNNQDKVLAAVLPAIEKYKFHSTLNSSIEYASNITSIFADSPILGATNLANDAYKDLYIAKLNESVIKHLSLASDIERQEFFDLMDSNEDDTTKATKAYQWFKDSGYSQKIYDALASNEQKNAYLRELAINTSMIVSSNAEYIIELTTEYKANSAELMGKLNNYQKNMTLLIEEKTAELVSKAELEKSVDELTLKQEELKAQIAEFKSSVGDSIDRLDTAVFGKVVVGDDGLIYTGLGEIIDYHGDVIGKHEMRLDAIEGEIVDMKMEMGQLGNNLDFTQNLLYGQLPTDKKLEALKNPYFMKNLDEATRAKEIKKLKLLDTVNDISSKFQKVAKFAYDVAKFGEKLGIGSAQDIKHVREFAKGASVVVSVANIAGAFISGNFIGGLMSLGGVAGLGGDSGDAQRHEEIMEALAQIDEKITIIDKKVDKVLELQIDTLKSIYALHNNLIESVKSIKYDLKMVLWEQQVLKEVVMDSSDLNSKINSCKVFLNTREITEELKPSYVDFRYGSFDNWSDLTYHLGSYEDKWQACEDGMSILFAKDDINSWLKMQSYSDTSGENGLVSQFIDPIYLPTLALLQQNYGYTTGVFYALANPSLDYSFDSRAFVDDSLVDDSKNNMGNISNLIHTQKLKYYTYMLMETLLYDNFRGVQKPYDIEEIVASNNSNHTLSFIKINSALKSINLAIAQQNLISGDLVVPLIHNKLFSNTPESEAIRDNTIRALANNSFLAHNYLVHQFRKEFELTGRNPDDPSTYVNRLEQNLARYRDMYDSCSDSCEEYMNLFYTNWNKEDGVIKTKIVGKEIHLESKSGQKAVLQMPHPDHIANNIYAYDVEINELIELRDKLISFAIENFRAIKIDNLYHTLYKDGESSNMPPVLIAAKNHLINDSETLEIPLDTYDIENDNVTIKITQDPDRGSAEIINSKLVYTPISGSSYDTSVTLELNDGNGVSDQQLDIAVIHPLNTKPMVYMESNFSLTQSSGSTLEFNVVDSDGDIITPIVTILPKNGEVIIADGKITYIPNENFTGNDSFVLRFDDLNGGVVDRNISIDTDGSNFDLNATDGLKLNVGLHQIAIANQLMNSEQITQVFGNINVNYILKYDSTSQKWLGYSNKTAYQQKMNDHNVETLTQLKAGEGIFVSILNTTVLNLPQDSGYKLTDQVDLTNLSSGWHLIGSDESINIDDLLKTNNNIKIILHYDNGIWYFYTTDPELKSQYLQANFNELTDLSAKNIGFWIYIQ